jgi:hypothetical protein
LRLNTAHIYRVEFRSRDVPRCYLKWGIKEFSHSNRVIWVFSRKRRDELLCCDRSAVWESHTYRICRLCGRKMIGIAAQVRQIQETEARQAGVEVGPCSVWCKDAASVSR